MKSINRVTMIGNLAADPEVRSTEKGVKVANFRLATSRDWVADDGDPTKTRADFHNVVAWDKLADVVESHLEKGSGVYIEGRLLNRSYETAEKQKRFVTEIRLDVLRILTWPKDGSTGGPDQIGDPGASSIEE